MDFPSNNRAGRPKMERSQKRVKPNVTLPPKLIKAAKDKAAERKIGISAFYEEALIREIARELRKNPSILEDATPDNVVPLKRKATIEAAAGSPIFAEVTEWDGEGDTVMVKINGLSMVPLLNDGDVISMHHRRKSRNPFMKKGLIYLVAYDGGYTVKEYNTRAANSEEKGEEWVENGKVKILKSLNPIYPEIIIKQPLEWVAWLEPKEM